eukprot:sb/3474181/
MVVHTDGAIEGLLVTAAGESGFTSGMLEILGVRRDLGAMGGERSPAGPFFVVSVMLVILDILLALGAAGGERGPGSFFAAFVMLEILGAFFGLGATEGGRGPVKLGPFLAISGENMELDIDIRLAVCLGGAEEAGPCFPVI